MVASKRPSENNDDQDPIEKMEAAGVSEQYIEDHTADITLDEMIHTAQVAQDQAVSAYTEDDTVEECEFCHMLKNRDPLYSTHEHPANGSETTKKTAADYDREYAQDQLVLLKNLASVVRWSVNFADNAITVVLDDNNLFWIMSGNTAVLEGTTFDRVWGYFIGVAAGSAATRKGFIVG